MTIKYPVPSLKVLSIIAAWLVTLGLVVWFFTKNVERLPTITLVSPNNTTVQVDKIVPNTVVKYVKDTIEVNRLLEENKKLHIEVTQLSESLATYQANGQGNVVMVEPDKLPSDMVPLIPRPEVPQPPSLFTFRDFRLAFVSDGVAAKYDLTQKFEILTSTGKNQQGVPVTTVKLFEVTPDKKIPVSDVTTTAIFADNSRPRWRVRPVIQAGVGLTQDWKADRINGGMVGVQWLQHGSTDAPRDIRYSALTPVIFASDTLREMGLLPFSYNVGHIKHQPFTNLWVSPYVGFDAGKKTVSRGGIAVTATF